MGLRHSQIRPAVYFFEKWLPLVFIACGLIFIDSGCTPSPVYRSGDAKPRTVKSSGNKSKAKPRRNTKNQTGLERTQFGIASYYGKQFHGRLTANGEVFDMYGISAAHKHLPLGTIVKIINLDNRKTLIVRINDRGPFVEGRIIDCSYGAAQKLGFVENGTANIRLEVVQMGEGRK